MTHAGATSTVPPAELVNTLLGTATTRIVSVEPGGKFPATTPVTTNAKLATGTTNTITRAVPPTGSTDRH